MLALTTAAAAFVAPTCRYASPTSAIARIERPPVCDLESGTRRETRFAPVVEISPGKRYRDMAATGKKFYEGRDSAATVDMLKERLKDVGDRKIVIITGASSGLGFFCVEKLKREDYYVVAAVRDTSKMDSEAERAGLSKKDYVAAELQLASFQSVRDFADDIKAALPKGKLDRLVCNAAVRACALRLRHVCEATSRTPRALPASLCAHLLVRNLCWW